MSETMKDLRRRRKTVENTEHITSAMSLVAASKFHKAKVRYDRSRGPVLQVMEKMEALLAQEDGAEVKDPERIPEPELEKPAVIVIFSGSRGLCGSYNSSLLKLAERYLSKDAVLIAVGSRGADALRRQGRSLAGTYLKPLEDMEAADAQTLADILLREWKDREKQEILLIRMRYINSLKQEGTAERILPAEKKGQPAEGANREMEFYPSKEAVLSWLLPKYLQLSLFQSALEAAVCEHAARRSAMEHASDSGREMLAALSLKYNRARQQAVTEELIEIVSGSEVLK